MRAILIGNIAFDPAHKRCGKLLWKNNILMWIMDGLKLEIRTHYLRALQ